jgi:hypothetical protein
MRWCVDDCVDVRIGEVRIWGGGKDTNSAEKRFREKTQEKKTNVF